MNESLKTAPLLSLEERGEISKFRKKVEDFKLLFHHGETPGTKNPDHEIKIRAAFYELEQQAEILDLALRKSLINRADRWKEIFFYTTSISILFLTGLCFAVIFSMYQAEASSKALINSEE